MIYETIIMEEKQGIAYLTINQPKNLNALNRRVLEELNDLLYEISKSDTIKVLIVTGEGNKAFVAGGDIKEMSQLNATQAHEFSQFGNQVFSKLAGLLQPSIAAVNGYALGGGCELALACDIRISSESAVFGQPEVGLGIMPGFGGTQRLTSIIGPAKAKELIFTTRQVKADEALSIGLVNRIVPDATLKEEANKMAKDILKQSHPAVQSAKQAINLSTNIPLDYGLELESALFAQLFNTENQKEGMKAFIEKRSPEFPNN